MKAECHMQNPSRRSQLDQPTAYQIKVQGRLDASWSEWFDGLAIDVAKDEQGVAVTTLTGVVVDQVALHGLLARIRDLCLPLLQVQYLGETTHPDSEHHEVI
jgi:hypothetical protein